MLSNSYAPPAFDVLERHLTVDGINETFTMGSFETRKEAINALVARKRSNADMTDNLRSLATGTWSILSAKAGGEAGEKLESCNQGEGLWAYV